MAKEGARGRDREDWLLGYLAFGGHNELTRQDSAGKRWREEIGMHLRGRIKVLKRKLAFTCSLKKSISPTFILNHIFK